jgi:putative endonuclease
MIFRRRIETTYYFEHSLSCKKDVWSRYAPRKERSGLLDHRHQQRFPMAWMYILECADGSYYVGSTKDIERRLWEHQSGQGAKYTSRRLPVKLVYSEEYECVSDAFYREKQVQNWSRAKREALINGEYEKLPPLAKKKFVKKTETVVE